jgi:hypothetical protein
MLNHHLLASSAEARHRSGVGDDEARQGADSHHSDVTPSSRSARLAVALAAAVAALAAFGAMVEPAHAGPDEPPGEEEPRPQRPPIATPTVDPPDVALELRWCLTDEQMTQLRDALEGSRDPAPDVRATCRSRFQRIGVWLRPVPTARADAYDRARDRGLAETRVLGDEPVLGGIMASKRLLDRSAAELERTLRGQSLNNDLEPAPGGKVRVRDVQATLRGPDRVVTTIRGERILPGPNAGFTAKVGDRLTLDRREPPWPECSSTLGFNIHTGPFFGLAVPGLWPFALEGALLELYHELQRDGSRPARGGVGCATAATVFPREIPIAGHKKIVFNYTRIGVSDRGITGYFWAPTEDRGRPSVRIVGPAGITAFGVGFFEVVPDEMLFMPATIDRDLDIAWTATGGQISDPGSARTRVRLLGQPIELRVRVQDGDGDVVETSASVPVLRLQPPALQP